jgi:hypothetical protein
MKQPGKIKFTAKIEKHEGMDACYIVFPHDVSSLFGVKGQVKVKALFDDSVTYRGSLVKMGTPCHILGITKEVRFKLDKNYGDEVSVVLELDTDVREVIIPEDVSRLLEGQPKAMKYFQSLSYTDRKEYIRWIETAQKEETRTRRIGIFIEKLKNHKKFIDR